MAYADTIRTTTFTASDIATLIEGVFGSSGPLAASSSWSPSYTGFSVNPTNVAARYWQIGKLVFAMVRMANTGTSNATTFTVSAPVTAVTLSNAYWGAYCWDATDNGSAVTGTTAVNITSGASTFTLTKGASSTGWTNANGKAANFCIWYEAA